MATETFRYIDYSDRNKFTLSEDGRIELKQYSDDLVFYVNFDSTFDAVYYDTEQSANITGTTTLENAGVFAQFGLLQDATVRYDKLNFENISEKGSVKFRVNPRFNNAAGYQEFNATDVSLSIVPYIDTNESRFGGASLNLKNANNITYSTDNVANLVQTGAINFFLKTDYTGTPSSNITILDIGNSGNDENRLRLTHQTDGNLHWELFDQSGSLLFDINFSWSADTNWHEVELDFDLNNGQSNFFIDGNSYGSSSATGTRVNPSDYLRLGGTSSPSLWIDDIGFFAEVQHTGSYSVRTVDFEDDATNLEALAHYDTTLNLDVGATTSYSSIDPASANYEIRVSVGGSYINSGNDIAITIDSSDTMNDIQNKLWNELQGTDATANLTSENKIRVSSTTNGEWVLVDEPNDGNSLISLLGGVGEQYLPNAPTEDVELFEFYNDADNSNRMQFIHSTDAHLYFKMWNPSGTLKVNHDLGIWNNEQYSWYAFEVNWNKTIAEIFLDGVLLDAFKTGFTRGNDTYFYISSGSSDYYGFDELIIYDQPQHSEDYTVEQYALTPYASDDPYIDIHFGSGYKENQVVDLNLNSAANIYFTVKIANTWYYYTTGAWRTGDGSFAQTVGPSTMETKFPELYFDEENEVVIRAYFHSDGQTLVWLDEISIVTETEEAQPAIIVGTVDLSSPVDLSTDYNVVITTNKETKEVDLSSAAADPTAVTLDEIKEAIDNANIDGLAPASDDGNGHLVLISSDTGKEAYVGISEGTTDNALDIVWGYEATDFGEQATGQFFDYSEIFRWIRAQLGAPTVPVELTDEQLQDCVSSAVYWYNYYRNAKERFVYVTLEGGPREGWKIPEEVGGEDNIIDIVMKPRFPYTFFTGRDDFIGQAYMRWFFMQYRSGYRHFLGDYYITMSTEQDINNIMGTNVQWHFYNGRIFIHPEPPQNMIIGIRFRSAVSMNEINTNTHIRNYALGKAKTVLGNIRATFGASVPGGSEMIQLRGEGLIQEGKEEMQQVLDRLRQLSEPLGFEWG